MRLQAHRSMPKRQCRKRGAVSQRSTVCHIKQTVQLFGDGNRGGQSQATFSPTLISKSTSGSSDIPGNDPRPKTTVGQDHHASTRVQHTASMADFPFCDTHSTVSNAGCNPFVFDINIRVPEASGKTRKVMKRVLLDTGSDLNLISAPAQSDIKTRVRPQKCHVRSVSGQSSIVGETRMEWTFIRSNVSNTSSASVFNDTFFVLSKKEVPLFDCILGRQWIHDHRSVFLDLWSS